MAKLPRTLKALLAKDALACSTLLEEIQSTKGLEAQALAQNGGLVELRDITIQQVREFDDLLEVEVTLEICELMPSSGCSINVPEDRFASATLRIQKLDAGLSGVSLGTQLPCQTTPGDFT